MEWDRDRRRKGKKVPSSDPEHFPVPGISNVGDQTPLSAVSFHAYSWFFIVTSFTLVMVFISSKHTIPH